MAELTAAFLQYFFANVPNMKTNKREERKQLNAVPKDII
jgi:hypothetical protein